MKFTRERILKYRAVMYSNKAINLLDTAVKEIARKKKFANWRLFAADFATGNDILVKFNNECEFCDFHFEDFVDSSKNEIIARLANCSLTEETQKILKSEQI